MSKVSWSGVVTSVQPRIRLLRSFDQISHAYLGYSLRVDGKVSGKAGSFWLGIGKAALEKCRFQIGDSVSGQAEPVERPELETVDYYKVSGLKHAPAPPPAFPTMGGPPWIGVLPDLETYRARGHRRLDSETYAAKCSQCMWASNMAVEMTIDHWNPSEKRYRTKNMCYRPLSCANYKKGPKRRLPGRKGMVWVEEDWIDKQNAEHCPNDA